MEYTNNIIMKYKKIHRPFFLQFSFYTKIFFLLMIFFHSSNINASSNSVELKKFKWTFEGVFGYYDRASIQRGFQVYNEVCASCHSMDLLTYRKLKDIGYSDLEVKVISASKTFTDGPNEEGEMFERPGLPSDKFMNPYKNKKAAEAANGGAYPKDLSLIVKSSPGGPNYIYSLLMGYEDAPSDFEVPEGKYYNKYFSGKIISMPEPLPMEGMVQYTDDTKPDKEQMVIDVTNFLQWASEPELEDRKKTGLVFMIFFVFLSIILYLLKKKIWKDVK
jgi:ubiquinol-cytochrome c reductase cytochrome c1 subunit